VPRVRTKSQVGPQTLHPQKVGFFISLFDIIMQRLFIICQVDLIKIVALGNYQGTSKAPLKIILK
jgi:hypothetical protein